MQRPTVPKHARNFGQRTPTAANSRFCPPSQGAEPRAWPSYPIPAGHNPRSRARAYWSPNSSCPRLHRPCTAQPNPCEPTLTRARDTCDKTRGCIGNSFVRQRFCQSGASRSQFTLTRARGMVRKFPIASTFISTTFWMSTFLEEPRRISKVCCSLQQILPCSPATVACESSKLCRSRPQQNMPRVRQNLPECYGSNLALAAAIPRGLRSCRGGLSATLSHFSSWRNRV